MNSDGYVDAQFTDNETDNETDNTSDNENINTHLYGSNIKKSKSADDIHKSISIHKDLPKKNFNNLNKTTQTNNTTETIMYSCLEGVCFEDTDGIYTTMDICIAACETREEEPREDGDEDVPPLDEGRDDDGDEDRDGDRDDGGVCPDEYYWCEEIKRCQHESDPCP